MDPLETPLSPPPFTQSSQEEPNEKPSPSPWRFLLVVLLILGIRAYFLYQESIDPAAPLPENSELQILFLDVGQADSALLTCNGQTMLIDGGNVGDGQKLYSILQERNISALDYVVCTHAHEDHVGGLSSALTACHADTILCPVTEYNSRAFCNFAERAGRITVPRAGDAFTFGSATVEILACDPTAEETNNTSIVLKITFGKTDFLFMGDAEYPVEEVMLDMGFDVSAMVLKVGHHGSSSSTSYRFLNEVMPQYAIISVGKENSYDHPQDEVLSRLRDADVTVYRTDLDGDILCISDGSKVTVTVP